MIGGSCRTRVNRDLRKRFKIPKAAEEYYLSLHSPAESHNDNSPPSSSVSVTIETIDNLAQLLQDQCQLDPERHLLSLSESFAAYCSRMNISVPPDFIALSIKGMLNLQSSKRSNILYSLAKGLGTQRPNDTDSLFPTKSVVTGLIEYSVNFFCLKTVSQVKVHYTHAHIILIIVVHVGILSRRL